jgi:DNA-binding Lrp family transcriptional regulator
MLSEDDLALIHALQLSPRGSWTELGRGLGVDPVTVARRFSRLAERGEAWVTVSPGPRLFDQLCVAFIDIDCAAGAAASVARTICGHPHAITIERSGGAQHLLATVATRDLATMSRYTLDVLPAVPHVAAIRTRIVTGMFTEGGRWRINALNSDQRSQLTRPSPLATPPSAPASHEITSRDRAFIRELSNDGRASYRYLAQALATSNHSAKRRIEQLIRAGLISFRCDFARGLGGWPVAATFWATAPADDLADIGHAIIQLPQTRNCAAISGTHNLIVQTTLHSVGDALRFEGQLTSTHPSLTITDRTITLRHEKLLGRILDPQGRSVGVVPLDVWSEPSQAEVDRGDVNLLTTSLLTD